MSQGIPRQPVKLPSTLEIVLANPYNFHYSLLTGLVGYCKIQKSGWRTLI